MEPEPNTSVARFSSDLEKPKDLNVEVGDEIYVVRDTIEGMPTAQRYHQTGIFIGENRVISKYSEGFLDKDRKCTGVIKCDVLDSLQWRNFKVKSKGGRDCKQRAMTFLKRYLEGAHEEFHFVLNNSEHFTQKCLSSL